MPEPRTDRARGALFGLAVGDALGTTLEFARPDVPSFPTRLEGPHRTITGAGPFRLTAGEVTDDTQMACCLAASLTERDAFDASDVLSRYKRWSLVAFDVGLQTRAALSFAADGGRAVWERRTGEKPAGNGSLMRTAPIGVRFAEDDDARVATSWADSSLTHFDPRCLFACVAFNGAVAAGVRGASTVEMLAAATHDLEAARARYVKARSHIRAELTSGARAIADDLRFAEAPDPHLESVSSEGGLDRGGDADTNGAITGALLGARHGEKAIPATWRDRVLNARGLEPRYHPRVLLEMI
ncbi:MAG TPA: ADP-ribosylglycohydrolase family protein [Polyangia bacterium]|nr:ADP-ribosylglycohydrolase family protein [Polyangia bacterium]